MGLETTAVLFSEIENIRVCYSLCACLYLCNSEFEKNASGLLGELYETDQEKSHELLTRKLQTWKKRNVLQLAGTAELMDFMEHDSCQTKLDSIWWGELSTCTTWWQV